MLAHSSFDFLMRHSLPQRIARSRRRIAASRAAGETPVAAGGAVAGGRLAPAGLSATALTLPSARRCVFRIDKA
jgi:hypothetical protein